MPQQDAETPKVYEPLEIDSVSFVPGDDSSEVLKPREQAFDLPATDVAAERASILSLRPSIRSMRGDHFDPAFFPQPFVQRVAFVRLVADQSIGGHAEEACVDRFFNERNFSWRST